MEDKSLIVEYLIIKQENTFCNTDKAFLSFLNTDSNISIAQKDNKIEFSSSKGHKLTISYSLISDLVASKKQRYFKLNLSYKGEKVKEYDEFLSTLRDVISHLDTDISINVLWNDVARNYAIEGYKLINEVENLLRRLITNFMLINVGYEWHKFHIPASVENRDSHLKENYSDYLHQTYFSDLKTILFEGQRDINFRNLGDVQRIVQKHISDGKTNIAIEDLKGVISESLWEKYFSKDTTYKKEHLEKELEELNTLRNEIAHNRHITRETLGRIENLSNKIIKTLKLAIEDLPNKVLNITEQEFQINTEVNRIEYIYSEYHLIEKFVREWYELNFNSDSIEQNVRLKSDNKFTYEFDILVRLSNHKFIGVEVRKFYKNFDFNKIMSKIIDYRIYDFNLIKEFHIVIIMNDSLIKDIILLEKEFLPFQNIPKIVLVIGIIENQVFKVIRQVKSNSEQQFL